MKKKVNYSMTREEKSKRESRTSAHTGQAICVGLHADRLGLLLGAFYGLAAFLANASEVICLEETKKCNF